MTTALTLETERLTLRPFEDRDRVAFAAMNADPRVMTYFAAPMSAEESDAAIARYAAARQEHGFSFFAAELRGTGAFAGLIGLQVMRDVVPGLPQPAVEIGWRLAREHQGRGLATEGARAVVAYAFGGLRLREVVAITAAGNLASRHVMEKLGMELQPHLEFDHPRLSEDHPHRRHVLYRLAPIDTTDPAADGSSTGDARAARVPGLQALGGKHPVRGKAQSRVHNNLIGRCSRDERSSALFPLRRKAA